MPTAEHIANRVEQLIKDVEVQHGRRPSDRERGGWYKLLFGRISDAEIELCAYGDGAPRADELGIALTLCPTTLDDEDRRRRPPHAAGVRR